ncbi:MAG: twin-arginine translocase TatA/TatE family subunit [Epsilonproteobacteria bacterium]|nr:MAG: twin-arginine translocase TatA/TatE family subunit [Campylobacterota bacterium]RLA67676.1 MAG: twin-arginine translocase TatA/TatE family subunit [Campylobacterota bacterium]
MLGLGAGELAVVGGILLLLFGGKKLPELGGAFAKSIKNFQKGLKENKKIE